MAAVLSLFKTVTFNATRHLSHGSGEAVDFCPTSPRGPASSALVRREISMHFSAFLYDISGGQSEGGLHVLTYAVWSHRLIADKARTSHGLSLTPRHQLHFLHTIESLTQVFGVFVCKAIMIDTRSTSSAVAQELCEPHGLCNAEEAYADMQSVLFS